jgi:hypothetical protein
MAITKRIVCLANSRKLSGRCVAGKELVNGKAVGWLRPVSARPSEEVSEREREYEDGSDPRVLDIIDIPLIEPRPKGYQTENWLLDPQTYWGRAGQASWSDLTRMADSPTTLWANGNSTYHGRNDKVSIAVASTLTCSLFLLRLKSAILRVFAPSEAFGDPRRRVQAVLVHEGVEYRLRVTDPVIEREYLALANGEHAIGECLVTISLGEPFKDDCYKLVATIITRGRSENERA